MLDLNVINTKLEKKTRALAASLEEHQYSELETMGEPDDFGFSLKCNGILTFSIMTNIKVRPRRFHRSRRTLSSFFLNTFGEKIIAVEGFDVSIKNLIVPITRPFQIESLLEQDYDWIIEALTYKYGEPLYFFSSYEHQEAWMSNQLVTGKKLALNKTPSRNWGGSDTVKSAWFSEHSDLPTEFDAKMLTYSLWSGGKEYSHKSHKIEVLGRHGEMYGDLEIRYDPFELTQVALNESESSLVLQTDGTEQEIHIGRNKHKDYLEILFHYISSIDTDQ